MNIMLFLRVFWCNLKRYTLVATGVMLIVTIISTPAAIVIVSNAPVIIQIIITIMTFVVLVIAALSADEIDRNY